MNIFILDEDPVVAAQMACDSHVVKMTLESAQLLSAILPEFMAPYKRTHYNHPCTKWARQTLGNYQWLCAHAKALAKEYTYRYDRRHKCEDIIDYCTSKQHLAGLTHLNVTPFAQAMPDQYKREDAVLAYRLYYIFEKPGFARWRNGRPAPDWWLYQSEPVDVHVSKK